MPKTSTVTELIDLLRSRREARHGGWEGGGTKKQRRGREGPKGAGRGWEMNAKKRVRPNFRTAGRRIRWRVPELTPKTPGPVASADMLWYAGAMFSFGSVPARCVLKFSQSRANCMGGLHKASSHSWHLLSKFIHLKSLSYQIQ